MIANWPEPKAPAYNTVSTIIRILEEKGFVGHDSLGRSHQYFPLISKTKYQKRLLRNVMDNVFSGSITGMVSSLLDNEKISKDEISTLKDLIENNDQE